MADLEVVAPDIWAVAAPQQFLGMHVGTRMCVVRLSNGGLLLHSPVAMSTGLRAAVDALGPVRHIVCPNDFHHLYAGQWAQAYPESLLHGPLSLQRKRKDLHFHAELTEQAHADWGKDLELLTIQGCMLNETVLYHPASRTLIASDLVENFKTSSHTPTRWYLRIQGLHGRVGWGRFMRFVYRDRRRARACVDRLLEWPFERVVVGHGDVLSLDVHEKIRAGMAWL